MFVTESAVGCNLDRRLCDMLRPMLTPSRFLSLAAAAATVLAGGVARAGVTLVFNRGDRPASTMSIDGPHLRIDGLAGNAMVFDAAGKRQIVINDADKSYMLITAEDVRRSRLRMAEARAQSEARLKSMSPEQRKKLEAMMGKKIAFGPMGAGKVKWERLNAKKTVAGFPCEMYRVIIDDTPRSEECVAAWGANLVQKSDFAGLRPFFEELAKAGGMGGAGQDFLGQLQKAPGFPISRVPLLDGGLRGEEERLDSVKRATVPVERFAIPAGYAKKEMPIMAGPGGVTGPPKAGPFRPLPPPKSPPPKSP
jgi:hypothetical protein